MSKKKTAEALGASPEKWASAGADIEEIVDELANVADRIDLVLANGAPPIVKVGLAKVRARLSETLAAAGRTDRATWTPSGRVS